MIGVCMLSIARPNALYSQFKFMNSNDPGNSQMAEVVIPIMISFGLPLKPSFSQPCNHCGLCCTLAVCEAVKIALPGVVAPCPLLLVHDKKALCGMVLSEESSRPPEERTLCRALGIGSGCSMPDPETTEQEIEAFDKDSILKMLMNP